MGPGHTEGSFPTRERQIDGPGTPVCGTRWEDRRRDESPGVFETEVDLTRASLDRRDLWGRGGGGVFTLYVWRIGNGPGWVGS